MGLRGKKPRSSSHFLLSNPESGVLQGSCRRSTRRLCPSSLYCWENWGISTLGSREETKVTTDVSTNPAEKRAERSHGVAGVSRASKGTGGEPADPTYLLPERVVWSLADVIINFLFMYHRESLEKGRSLTPTAVPVSQQKHSWKWFCGQQSKHPQSGKLGWL